MAMNKKQRRLLQIALAAIDNNDTEIATDVLHTVAEENGEEIVDLSTVELPPEDEMDRTETDSIEATACGDNEDPNDYATRAIASFTRALSRSRSMYKLTEAAEESDSLGDDELDALAVQFDEFNTNVEKVAAMRRAQAENLEDDEADYFKAESTEVIGDEDSAVIENTTILKTPDMEEPHITETIETVPTSIDYKSPLNQFGKTAFKGNTLKPSAAIAFYLQKKIN